MYQKEKPILIKEVGATLKILQEIMKTYKITGRTNGWIAQRDSLFKGKEYITIERGLTLKEAQKKILDFFNEDYGTCYKNWGLVRCNSDMAFTHNDGTRGYEYDSRYFEIEEEDEDKPSVYRVEGQDGTCLYIGSCLIEAIDSILDDEEPEHYKLYDNEEILWDGEVNSINRLEYLRAEAL